MASDAELPADHERAHHLVDPQHVTPDRKVVWTAVLYTRPPGNPKHRPKSVFIEDRMEAEQTPGQLHRGRLASYWRMAFPVGAVRGLTITDRKGREQAYDYEITMSPDGAAVPFEDFASSHADLGGSLQKEGGLKRLGASIDAQGELSKPP